MVRFLPIDPIISGSNPDLAGYPYVIQGVGIITGGHIEMCQDSSLVRFLHIDPMVSGSNPSSAKR